MSYALSHHLQAAVYQRLTTDPALTALVGSAVFDAAPPGEPPATYVSLGPEDVRDRSDKTASAAEHRFTVTVVTDAAGFHAAKAVAAAVSGALDRSAPVMARGRIVQIQFLRARARRVRAAQVRRIDLTFRAHVEDD